MMDSPSSVNTRQRGVRGSQPDSRDTITCDTTVSHYPTGLSASYQLTKV